MTTPYTTGTVSVTNGSAIVTGVGTAWLTSGLVPGQFGLDSTNGNPVPVLSIQSDTQLTLAKPWRGTTAATQAYWITYDTNYAELSIQTSQMLAEYVARLGKPFFQAMANLTPAVDTLPYFGPGAVGALTSLNAASRSLLGLNAAPDLLPYMSSTTGYSTTAINAAARALLAGGVITDGQLPGRIRSVNLTYPADLNGIIDTGFYGVLAATTNSPASDVQGNLIHIQYASNRFTQTFIQAVSGGSLFNRTFQRNYVNGVWSIWHLVGIPILGTVFQQSGQPRGAIIERGSNANGEYVRFADGTQICLRDLSLAETTAATAWTFPVAFAAIPRVSVSGQSSAPRIGTVDSNSASGCSFSLWSTAGVRQASTPLVSAMGRWF